MDRQRSEKTLWTDIQRMTAFVGLMLPYRRTSANPEHRHWRLWGPEAGDASGFRAKHVNFVFIKTHSSMVFAATHDNRSFTQGAVEAIVC